MKFKLIIVFLRSLSDITVLILGLVVFVYFLYPVENIIFHWFENNTYRQPGNHLLTSIAAIFFNIIAVSSLWNIYMILAITTNNLIEKRHKQDLKELKEE